MAAVPKPWFLGPGWSICWSSCPIPLDEVEAKLHISPSSPHSQPHLQNCQSQTSFPGRQPVSELSLYLAKESRKEGKTQRKQLSLFSREQSQLSTTCLRLEQRITTPAADRRLQTLPASPRPTCMPGPATAEKLPLRAKAARERPRPLRSQQLDGRRPLPSHLWTCIFSKYFSTCFQTQRYATPEKRFFPLCPLPQLALYKGTT